MGSRESLQQQGDAIRALFKHGTYPGSTPSPNHSVPGVARLTAEVAFGAVWSRPGLGMRERMVSTLSALTCLQHLPQLRTYIHSALTMGMDSRPIQEIFIQCAIYAGFPTMVNALRLAQEAFVARGVPVPETTLPDYSLEELDSKGRELMQQLHGERSKNGYAAPDNSITSGFYPVAIQFGYGEIWHRPDLDFRSRAICSVASFTALGLESQLEKFIQAARNMGLSVEEIVEVVIQTAPYSGFPKALNGLALASKVLS